MKKLVYIQTDMVECNKFAIIDDSLLDDLEYLMNNCFYNGEIFLVMNYTKPSIMKLDDYDFIKNDIENLCLGADDSDYNDPEKVKSILKKIAKYYNVDAYFNYELIYKSVK